jgi:hypothetical protein
VGAENSVTSCDLQILVYETTEAISSQRPNGRCGVRGSAACGRVLMERSVRAVRVVVLDVFLQHRREVARSSDEDVVEALRLHTCRILCGSMSSRTWRCEGRPV